MKKSVLQILTLALALINLVLTCLLIFTCMPAISKTGELVNRVCEIIDLDLAGASGNLNEVDINMLEEIAVTFNGEKTISLNLKEGADGKGHHAVVGVSIVVDKGHDDYKSLRPTVENAMSQIDTKIIEVITKYTMEQANNNKEEIRKELLGELRQLFGSKFIYDISFTSFITQ